MAVKVMTSKGMLNVVSAYAPQVGCKDEEKEAFFTKATDLVREFPVDERLVIEADLNGHVGGHGFWI